MNNQQLFDLLRNSKSYSIMFDLNHDLRAELRRLNYPTPLLMNVFKTRKLDEFEKMMISLYGREFLEMKIKVFHKEFKIEPENAEEDKLSFRLLATLWTPDSPTRTKYRIEAIIDADKLFSLTS